MRANVRARRGKVVASLGAVALILAACGGGSDDPEEPDDPAAEEAADGEAAEAEVEEITFDDNGVLQPLADGFPEREITLVVVDDPGTRDAVYATDMQAALEEISPVDITISYEPSPQGGTIPTLADTMERNGGTEGYYPVVTTLVGTPTDMHIEPIEQDFGLGLDDINFVIATESQPYTLVQRADAPWGDTFEDLVAYAQENPGELRYLPPGVGSGHDIHMEWMMDGLGMEVQKIPTAGHQESLAAIGAGEGDFVNTRAELARQFEEDGRVEVLFQSTEEMPEPWATEDTEGRIGTAAAYEELGLDQIPWGIVLGYMIPAEAGDSHTQWLHELFKAGAATEGWQNRLNTIPGLVDLRRAVDAGTGRRRRPGGLRLLGARRPSGRPPLGGQPVALGPTERGVGCRREPVPDTSDGRRGT